MNLSEEIRSLEAQGVFIHVGHDHYKDGSNCNWALQFMDVEPGNKKRQIYHTSWYGDNHEFGDTVDCYLAAFRLAKFLLEGDNAKWFFFSVKETVTDQGMKDYLKSMEVREKADEIFWPNNEHDETA